MTDKEPHDTAGHSVCGDYLLHAREGHDHFLMITHGLSKAHRPGLKQLALRSAS